MQRCRFCGWQAVAPSATAANEQYEKHLREAHVSTDEADDPDIPDGTVQVRVDGEWQTRPVGEDDPVVEGHDD